jgi:hypothetical protein
MSKNYKRSLQEHVKIAEEHATFLVQKLARLAVKAKKIQEKHGILEPIPEELQEIYQEMHVIVQDLGCVEQWVKSNYPDLVELWDAINNKVANEKVN